MPGVRDQLKDYGQKLKDGPLPPFVVLVSESTTVLDRAREMLVEEALPPAARSLNRQTFSGRDSSPANWLVAARSAPMLARRRLVLVSEADGWLVADPPCAPAELDALRKFAEPPPGKGLLVLAAARFSRGAVIVDLAQKAGWFFVFSVESKGAGIEELMAQILRQRKVSIDPDAVDALVEACGDSLDTLQKEAEKLAAFAGPGGHISRFDVIDMVQRLQGHHLYEFSKAVAGRDAARALTVLDRLYRNLIEEKKKVSLTDLPVRLLSYLSTDFSNMAMAASLKDAGSPSTLADRIGARGKAGARKAHEAAARSALGNCRRFSESELAAALSAIHHADRRLKSTGIDARLLLEELVFSICARNKRDSATR